MSRRNRTADTIPPPPTGALDATTLYIGDNGRVHCGALRCAGHTAHATGRDLGGMPVLRIDPDVVTRWAHMIGEPPACETCGRVATLIAGPDGASITRERAS